MHLKSFARSLCLFRQTWESIWNQKLLRLEWGIMFCSHTLLSFSRNSQRYRCTNFAWNVSMISTTKRVDSVAVRGKQANLALSLSTTNISRLSPNRLKKFLIWQIVNLNLHSPFVLNVILNLTSIAALTGCLMIKIMIWYVIVAVPKTGLRTIRKHSFHLFLNPFYL